MLVTEGVDAPTLKCSGLSILHDRLYLFQEELSWILASYSLVFCGLYLKGLTLTGSGHILLQFAKPTWCIGRQNNDLSVVIEDALEELCDTSNIGYSIGEFHWCFWTTHREYETESFTSQEESWWTIFLMPT
jgi:hypothetical protein